jgi:pteridine reductase
MPTAIITGGAVRLGKSFALYLASKGYDIALHFSRMRPEAQSVLDQLNSMDVKSKGYTCDFSNMENSEDLLNKISEDFSDITLLINSAANFIQENIEETRSQSLLDTFHINLFSPFILMREYKKKFNQGMIVNILDERILRNVPTFAAYSVSKVGLAHLTRIAAIEWGTQVRVNGIAPGLILPPAGQDDSYLKRESKHVPTGNHGSPENLINGLNYLLENSFVNGEILFIDGGESLNPGYTFPQRP